MRNSQFAQKIIGIALALFGGAMFLTTVRDASHYRFNFSSYGWGRFVGAAVGGLIVLGLGLWLAKIKIAVGEFLRLGSSSESEPVPLPVLLQRRAALGITGGVVIIRLGSDATAYLVWIGALIVMAGWAVIIWGCVNLAKWKGFSSWFGLFGYLLLPGILVLLCLPNRRKRILETQAPDSEHASVALSTDKGWPLGKWFLTLAPLVVLLIGWGAFVSQHFHIGNAWQWGEVGSPDLGFRALMPGSPQMEKRIKETSTGNVELYKFTVKPGGDNGAIVIVLTRFPKDLAEQLGGMQKLLEIGRKDLLAAASAMAPGKNPEIKSEQKIALSGWPGLELEVVPPTGTGMLKGRVYAGENQVYELLAFGSQFFVESADIQKFFDSFSVIVEADASAKGAP